MWHRGVALKVGRNEETMREEVMTIIFDRSRFTEAEAAKWWDRECHRFDDKLHNPTAA